MRYPLRVRALGSALSMVGVSLLLGACSDGADSESESARNSFGEAVPDSVAPAPEVATASSVLLSRMSLEGELGRCMRVQLPEQIEVIDALNAADDDELPGAAAELIEACEQAVRLAPAFVSGMAGGTSDGALRRCLQDVFFGLSPRQRSSVTAVVTGVGSDDDRPAAAEMAEGVEACRIEG